MKSYRLAVPALLMGGLFALMPVVTSCKNDRIVQSEVGEETTSISFEVEGAALRPQVTTRATVTPVQEGRVENIFLFIFNGTDDNSAPELAKLYKNGELVTDMDGKRFRLTVPSQVGNGVKRIVAIANVRNDENDPKQPINSFNEETLRQQIKSFTQLKALQAKLENNNFFNFGSNHLFLMVSDVREGKVENGKLTLTGNSSVLLKRLHAKVELRVVNSPNFEVKDWKVCNLPKKAYVVQQETSPITDKNNDVYASEYHKFVGEGRGDRLDFYMLESNLQPTKRIESGDAKKKYRDRMRRKKISAGDKETNGDFEYAPIAQPYIVVRGVYFGTDPKRPQDGQILANLELTIPLGYTDKKDPANDYKVERNKHYLYKITVSGVNDLIVEAGNGDENNPGVEGDALISQNNYVTADSHYQNGLITFNQGRVRALDFDNIWLRVRTPYGERTIKYSELSKGTSRSVGSASTPQADEFNKLCKWLTFRRNPMDWYGNARWYGDYYQWVSRYPGVSNIDGFKQHPDQPSPTDVNEGYKDWYPKNFKGSGCMNLVAFLDRLKWAKTEADKNSGGDHGATQGDNAIFEYNWRNRGDLRMSYFTVFIDEFFYEKNPLTEQPAHWQEFVNTTPRELAIMQKHKISKDGKSQVYTEPILIIRQRPIYTVFEKKDNGDVYAYGVESTNEWGTVNLPSNYTTRDLEGGTKSQDFIFEDGWNNTWIYLRKLNEDKGEGKDKYWLWKNFHQDPDNNPAYQNFRPWEWMMKDPILACMYRNRDDNRNGRIEPEEIKWYCPAIGQLINIALGDKGLPADVRLYQSVQNRTSQKQSHWYVSSTPDLYSSRTVGKNYTAYFLWSEQGFTTGGANYTDFATGGNDAQKRSGYNLRCIRNLGVVAQTNKKTTFTSTAKLIKENGGKPMMVELTTMNHHSVRLPSDFVASGEASPKHHFLDYSSVPAPKFYVSEHFLGYEESKKIGKLFTYTEVFEALKQKTSPCASYSEKGITGWRMPNMREMMHMVNATLNDSNNPLWTGMFPDRDGVWTSTFTEEDDGVKFFLYRGGWQKFHINNEFQTARSGLIRCIKDVE